MKRSLLALCAAMLAGLLGLGSPAAPAQAYPGEQFERAGARSATVSRVERRSARSTRASARRAAARSARTTRAVRSTGAVALSSLTGGGQTGIASFYWQGQRTANGERFNPGGLTAAHRTLPFGTRVRVTNMSNGRSVTVRINDRGPFIAGRIIDLSRGAAQVVGMTGQGLARVSVAVIGR
jgi:rare lipoprotein A